MPDLPLGAGAGREIGHSVAVTAVTVRPTNAASVVLAGASVGVLGGLIGLGGAEFRLPLLISVFGFAALSAVILNKAMSLIVVLTALPVRLVAIPHDALSPHWNVVVNLLAGSLLGAWIGATAATRMHSATLYRVLSVLLALIAIVLVGTHLGTVDDLGLEGPAQVVAGIAAGYLIGLAASVMGVAGGELLIPTIVLLYGIDVKDRRQPVADGVAPHHGRGVRPLQPRRQLRRAPPPPTIRAAHGVRNRRRNRCWWSAGGNRARRRGNPAPGHASAHQLRQRVATRHSRSHIKTADRRCALGWGNRCDRTPVGGSRSDVERVPSGELAPVVVVVLGRVVVNVGHGHNFLEVGIPADREVHREFECVLGLPGEAAAQMPDGAVHESPHDAAAEDRSARRAPR